MRQVQEKHLARMYRGVVGAVSACSRTNWTIVYRASLALRLWNWKLPSPSRQRSKQTKGGAPKSLTSTCSCWSAARVYFVAAGQAALSRGRPLGAVVVFALLIEWLPTQHELHVPTSVGYNISTLGPDMHDTHVPVTASLNLVYNHFCSRCKPTSKVRTAK